MIKKYGFIALLALLSSVSPVLANGCCGDAMKPECTEEKAADCCKSEETCAACEQAGAEENAEEKLMCATKIDYKVSVRGEESAGTTMVIEGIGLNLSNNEMLVKMEITSLDENNVRIDAMMIALNAEGTPVAHEPISRDVAWGMAADFAWEDDNCPVQMSVVALEKCMVAVSMAPQA